MKLALTLLALSFVSVSVAACSSSAEPTPLPQPSPNATTAPTQPPPSEKPPGTTTTGPAGCHTIDQVASSATLFFDSKPEPAAQGGELEDGLYILEKVTRYGVSAPVDEPRPYADRMTMRYTDGVADFVVNEMENTTPKRSTSTVTLNGSNLTAKDTCPASTRSNAFRYTANGNTLDLYVTSAGMKFVQHFVRFK